MSEASDAIVLLSTCPAKDADRIGVEMVQSGLAACVNIVPSVRSIYIWKGKIEQDDESLLFIKARRDALEELIAAVLRAHPYDVPEVVALPIAGGNPAYLSWVMESGSADES